MFSGEHGSHRNGGKAVCESVAGCSVPVAMRFASVIEPAA
jgi:hypothetical protein